MQMMYAEGGYLGIDPLPYTLRNIITMADGKRKNDWSRNSAVVAMIHNVNCKEKDQKQPAFFNPTLSESERKGHVEDSKAGFEALKMMLKIHLQKRETEYKDG